MNEDYAKYQKQLKQYLAQFSRDKSVGFALSLLSEGKVTVGELYEQIVGPALGGIVICREEEDTCIWKEHIMTNVVRSIVENAEPYVLKERNQTVPEGTVGKVMIFCPEEEYHEIGARMGADFFTILGFDVFFIGCNLPKSNIVSAYETLKPDVIAISVTNYLNLISLKKYIEEIRTKINEDVKITISGSALAVTGKTADDFGADALIRTMDDIRALRRDLYGVGI